MEKAKLLVRLADEQYDRGSWGAARVNYLEAIEALKRQLGEAEASRKNWAQMHRDACIRVDAMAEEAVALAAEVQALRGQVPAVVGATSAYCCSLLDQGVDPRKVEVPQMLKDITNCIANITSSFDEPGQAQAKCKACGTESVFVPGHGRHRFCLCRAPADQQEGGQEKV